MGTLEASNLKQKNKDMGYNLKTWFEIKEL